MWVIIVLVAVLPLCFIPILMALDTREDDRRTREYEAEREAFYTKLRKERESE